MYKTIYKMTRKDSGELKALIYLLDEPDEDLYNQVRDKIIAYGQDVINLLEERWSSDLEEREITRIEDIIDQVLLNKSIDGLNDWIKKEKKDLLEPFLILSAYHDPDFAFEEYKKSVERIIKDVWLEINDELTALEKIKIMNHVFYNVHGFKSINSNSTTISSYLLSNVLRLKRGNHLSLAILYLIVAQNAGLPLFGVNLPHHFILSYMEYGIPENTKENYYESRLLFYINPFNDGVIFKRNEIELYLKQIKLDILPEYFLPIENILIIKRLIREMMVLQKKNNNLKKLAGLKKLLTILD